ncbi:MAG: HPF/RaiA family ribosome-associated protein [Phycisphaerae bacterium]|jgi:ribosome-associated translation inhibitor RaiA
MKIPIEIAVKNLVITDEITNLINKKAAKLDRICDHITSCRVSIERPYLHQSSGNPYRVRVDITVPPGHELVAKEEAGTGDMHEPLPGVIKNAFHSAQRQLKKLVDLQHGNVKTHPQSIKPQSITNL